MSNTIHSINKKIYYVFIYICIYIDILIIKSVLNIKGKSVRDSRLFKELKKKEQKKIIIVNKKRKRKTLLEHKVEKYIT